MTEAPSERGTIGVLNRDLFFGVRLGNQLRARGYAVSIVQETAAFVALVETADPPLVLGILDMNMAIDWPRIAALTNDPPNATPLLAFGPHTDVAGRRAAKAAGVTRLVSNGDFHQDMIALVERYAHRPPTDAPSAPR